MPPASFFVGDSGAYFLGFSLSAVALYAPALSGQQWTPIGFLACIVVFTPYLFDTGFTLIRRLKGGAGKNIFLAHREHIYQRITPTTQMHRRTSNLYYGLSIVAGLAALLISRSDPPSILAGLAVSQIQLRPDPSAHHVPLRVEDGFPSLPPHSETTS